MPGRYGRRQNRVGRLTLWRLAVRWIMPYAITLLLSIAVVLVLMAAINGIPWVYGIAATPIVYVLALCALSTLSYDFERAAFIQGVLFHQLRMTHRFDEIRGKPLEAREQGWEYADDSAFVRVGRRSACVLFAADIDFTEVIRHTEKRIYKRGPYRMVPRNTSYDVYVFKSRTGGTIAACADRAADLFKWIERHGGRTKRTAL